jgi:hypothetical protein
MRLWWVLRWCLIGWSVTALAYTNISKDSIYAVDLTKESSSFAHEESGNFLLTPAQKLIKQTEESEALTRIGSGSYFENPNFLGFKRQTLSSVGIAFEDRTNQSSMYLFFNQLLPNNLFYEIRLYFAYTYLGRNPPLSSIPASAEEPNPIGYGTIGILGYNIDITSSISLMPFIWVSDLVNTMSVYRDSLGNSVSSNTYNANLGLKASVKITDQFAIYGLYMAGYQSTQLYGQGVYSGISSPDINAFISSSEFGLPYRLGGSWSFTPYVRFNSRSNYPNAGASGMPYEINSFNNSVIIYGMKLGYGF